MAKKCYAVRKGYKPGIYTTWSECQKQVSGYPNAEFKGFESRELAEEYLSNGTLVDSKKTGSKKATERSVCVAYVDGSYNPRTGVYGYGAILIYQGKQYEFTGYGSDRIMAKMRNVAGEINGCMRAIKEVLVMKEERFPEIDTLHVYYDYFGIEKWAVGEWQTTKKGTQEYAEYVKEKQKEIAIEFKKVRGHSGDEMNNAADVLAKKAVGIL